MCTDRSTGYGSRQAGISLIEVIIFIVVVGVGITALMSAIDSTVKHSPDAMVQKQAVAIAESLLEEIELQPFTICDPNDPHYSDGTATPTTSAQCTTGFDEVGTPGAEAFAQGKTRYADPRFNNVGDYGGFSMTSGIKDINNNAVSGLGAYQAQVAITQVGGTGAFAGFPLDAVLRIVVTVTTPGGEPVVLTGYRCRYAPSSLL
jgi:MSHA pilin protein MshD